MVILASTLTTNVVWNLVVGPSLLLSTQKSPDLPGHRSDRHAHHGGCSCVDDRVSGSRGVETAAAAGAEAVEEVVDVKVKVEGEVLEPEGEVEESTTGAKGTAIYACRNPSWNFST